MSRVSIRRKLWERAREFADEEDMTVNEVVEDALEAYLDEEEEDEEDEEEEKE